MPVLDPSNLPVSDSELKSLADLFGPWMKNRKLNSAQGAAYMLASLITLHQHAYRLETNLEAMLSVQEQLRQTIDVHRARLAADDN